ncbi:MAG: NUDIX hydrolase [Ignavibacteria bacterium]|nr:NUDIX hydrolase [Ignavibacteria bacterium]
MTSGKVVLVRYKKVETGWSLPFSDVNFSEHPEDAALRVLKIQLGYITGNLKLSHIESFTDIDGIWNLIFHFFQVSDSQPQLLPSEDIDTYHWFPINELPPQDEIAFQGRAKFTINKIKYQLR